MTEKETITYQVNWRMQYIATLENRKVLLAELIAHYENIATKDLFDTKKDSGAVIISAVECNSRKIELLELEHKLTYARIALNDWKARAKEYDDRFSEDVKEAKEKIDELMEKAKSFHGQYPTPRLASLLVKYNTVNRHNEEQLNIFYKSLKVELKNQKAI